MVVSTKLSFKTSGDGYQIIFGPELFYLTIGLKNVQYRTFSNAILIGSNTSYWIRNGSRTLLSDPTKITAPDKKT